MMPDVADNEISNGGSYPGGGGGPFCPETLNTREGLHHCGQFSPGFNDLGCSHLVPVEGKYM